MRSFGISALFVVLGRAGALHLDKRELYAASASFSEVSQTAYNSWDADIGNNVLGDASLDFHQGYDVLTSPAWGAVNPPSPPGMIIQSCSVWWAGAGNYTFVGKAGSQ